jgi:uncharacterized protein YcaQ
MAGLKKRSTPTPADAPLDVRTARRLALNAALLLPLPDEAQRRRAASAEEARAHARKIIQHFGYLQLDTVSIAGARSHSLVLGSRIDGFPTRVGEELLRPGEPHFEYWGHEACWLPLELYGHFEFRRRAFRTHPWWGNVIDAHRTEADQLLERIRAEGSVKSADLEGERGRGGWWDLKLSKKICDAWWSSGELAVRERVKFQKSFDLTERVVPKKHRKSVEENQAVGDLLVLALRGHGWATLSTLAATWRFRNRAAQLKKIVAELVDAGRIVPLDLEDDGKRIAGFVTPEALENRPTLESLKPSRTSAVLLSPFDPLLWDRDRVSRFFNFDQVLEIYKPAPQRKYGYFCLPVLCGEQLIARVDLKANLAAREISVLSVRYESTGSAEAATKWEAQAVENSAQEAPRFGAGRARRLMPGHGGCTCANAGRPPIARRLKPD